MHAHPKIGSEKQCNFILLLYYIHKLSTQKLMPHTVHQLMIQMNTVIYIYQENSHTYMTETTLVTPDRIT